MAKDPNAVATKWATNLGNSTPSITAGVDAVSTAPTASAAQAVGKWQAAMAAQKTKDKFVAGLNRVSLSDWQTAMKNKGVARIASGAQSAQPKMAAFLTQLLPYADNVSATIKKMPKLTLQDSIARATQAITMMSQFKRTS